MSSNRNRTVSAISQELGITKVAASELFSEVINVIKSRLEVEPKGVVLTGFGRLIKHTRSARNGRNPKTGESVQIPERQLVKFKQY